ncbi:kelch-like protein 10 [Halichoeres trimaculatus]|uniref:kelch-like protein 10 n=1 Tax=Halichoeres trimaculatus TaxID=147232 RepID=UPI003D9F2910
MMKLMIEFAYTGSVSVNEDNVQELMLAADQFNITDIVKACCDFLGEQLCPENCIGIWRFSNITLTYGLQSKAFNFITNHFQKVVSTEEFLQLSLEELLDILEKDELNVSDERFLFRAVTTWIHHNPEEREKHITMLLSKIRLVLAGMTFIRSEVMSNELVRNNAACMEALEALLADISRRPSITGLLPPFACPRLPPTILLAIGGWSGGDPTNGIEAYNVRVDRWVSVLNDQERPRAYHGTVFLNGCVYCVGGFDRAEYFNSVRRLDLSTYTWHEVAPMHYRRCYVSVTVMDGYIYALGGYDRHSRLNTAERYKPENNQWSLIAPMHDQRSDASCTTFNNKVYICGGFNGNECLESCEYYSPETDQWTMISPMSSRRSGIGITTYAGYIYAVGGFDGNTRLQSVEAYNPCTNSWHAVPSMLNPRSNFGIEVINDFLFAVGGFNGFTTSCDVEFFDATTNKWYSAANMEILRSAVSCCVVPWLPNMARFMEPFNNLLMYEFGIESDESEDSEQS